MNELLHHYWTQIVTVVALAAAWARTEMLGRMNRDRAAEDRANAKEALAALEARIQTQRNEDVRRTNEDLREIKETTRAMWDDIRRLLQRGGN